ncbi:Hsp20/alpha crystallin family protein [Synoicihabitans lomoniglobus]|uniref:Hsp20/alpha crystallin family protein n=1 Tax=Synoicihabitans lomoniglobus TaxID=2909285 RepID=A0AAF0CM99_9BACT|nr:Hsp20/alpha crystallin family protein [Opitutaceae bacterium LMO-M01]WED63006.1 Hsp20/alpha crystallin family protein [Opitutaceae bacterium LMO-M01]
MNNIALPTKSAAKSRLPESVPCNGSFCTPHFDCETLPDALRLVVFLPEVHPRAVEIATRGTDLTVSARKAHHVRANWKSMHLEGVQRDYLLNLRLGRSLDFTALQAELRDGALTLTIPKRHGGVTGFRPESNLVA